MKKTLLVLSAILLLISLAVSMTVSASAKDVIRSGTWGDLTWTFNETTGELKISGEGKMDDFDSESNSAWKPYNTSIYVVTIESGVTSLGAYAFSHSYVTNITIPSSVTSIGDFALSSCDGLLNLVIPSSVTSIGEGAFCYCNSLTSVTIPASVTIMEDFAFFDCFYLKSVYFDKNSQLTSIGSHSFAMCPALTSIELPNSLTSISDGLFTSCNTLTSVRIPSSVKSIGAVVFSACSALNKIVYDGTAEEWKEISKNADWDKNAGNYTLEMHTHEYQSTVTVPTCTEKGYTTYSCKTCDKVYVDTYVDATGHTYDNERDATCNTCSSTREIIAETQDGSNAEDSGCGSSLTSGAAMLLLLVATMGGALLRKRKI